MCNYIHQKHLTKVYICTTSPIYDYQLHVAAITLHLRAEDHVGINYVIFPSPNQLYVLKYR